MNEHDIREPEDLDAAIAKRAVSEQVRLENAADGRSMSFSVAVMLLVSFVMLVLGFVSTARSEAGATVVPALMGTIFLLSAMVMRLEGQLRAFRELQKRSDRQVQLLARRVLSDT